MHWLAGLSLLTDCRSNSTIKISRKSIVFPESLKLWLEVLISQTDNNWQGITIERFDLGPFWLATATPIAPRFVKWLLIGLSRRHTANQHFSKWLNQRRRKLKVLKTSVLCINRNLLRSILTCTTVYLLFPFCSDACVCILHDNSAADPKLQKRRASWNNNELCILNRYMMFQW